VQAGNVIFSLYLLGIAIAMITGLAFKRIIYRDKEPQPFVMELPPYRVPNPKIVLLQMWGRIRSFVRKAATLILACSIGVWLLTAMPSNLDMSRFASVEPHDSIFGALSSTVAPLFTPTGFGNWQASGALITGFVAKEVVVSTMSQIYRAEAPVKQTASEPTPTPLDDAGEIVTSFGRALVLTGQEFINIIPRTVNIIPGMHMSEANFLRNAVQEDDTSALGLVLRGAFTPLSAAAFMVFVLLYTPCMTATAAMRQEFGTHWMLCQMTYATFIAWTAAAIVYQGGLLLGLGG
jgi:ferrous iron transport protein B